MSWLRRRRRRAAMTVSLARLLAESTRARTALAGKNRNLERTLSAEVEVTRALVTRLHDLGATRHFWVGMSKAPVFAFLIATIGCLEGFKVSGSAASVGTHTTSSVVQAIFMAILVDALAAVFFMEIDV